MAFRAPTFLPRIETLESRDTPSTLYGLTVDNHIVQFDSSSPGTIAKNVGIANLNPTERVVDIDFRPRTGGLYGLGITDAGAGTTARLLLINPLTGTANPVGNPFTVTADATGQYGIDFNPVADRLRVVSRVGTNLRLDPATGAVTTDTNILLNGPVTAAGYDRDFDGKLGVAGTTLYTINPITGNLQTQGSVNGVVSPNTGTQFVVGPLNSPLDSSRGVGFDITPNGTAAGGPAYALFDGDTSGNVATALYTINLTTGAATAVGLLGDGSGNFIGLAVAPESRFAVGSGAGMDSKVEVYDSFTGGLLKTLNPYPGFQGGVTTAIGDVNRDGVPDVITGASTGGGPHVKVFDGVTFNEIDSFYAYAANFNGGVNVAAGDVNGDGFADIITGAGPSGGPHVKAFSGKDLTELASFFAYDASFAGGVRVAAGDFNADGTDEIVTAAGPGGGPHVKVYGYTPLAFGGVAPFTGGAVPNSFYAYASTFGGGVWVAAGDINGDGIADLITGADAGGGPHVRMIDGKSGSDIGSFYGFNSDFSGGVRVGVGDTDRDGRMEVLVAPASGRAPVVRAFDGNTGTLLTSFDVLGGASSVFVGGGFA